MESEPSVNNGRQQSAVISVSVGSFALKAKVEVTPAGLMSIAAMVCGILLSAAVVVQAARK